MRFLGGLSLSGVYLMNWIGALWFDFYIGLFSALLAFFAWILGLNPWEVLFATYSEHPSLRRALWWKLIGLVFNVLIARVYYDGFKRYNDYKDTLNLAATEDTTAAIAALVKVDGGDLEEGEDSTVDDDVLLFVI